MRKLLAVLLILSAAPAAAESARNSPPSLRGAQSPEARGAKAPAPPPMSPIAPAPSPLAVLDTGGAPARCRLMCAQGYYQCLSADDFDQCVPVWNRCRAGCEGPSYSVGGVGRR